MRRLVGFTAVIAILLAGIQDAATAGVLWFQTTEPDVARRTGTGVLTLPRPIAATLTGNLVIWTPRRVLVSGAAGVGELRFQGESIEDTLGVVPFFQPGEEDEPAGALLIWTPTRVLVWGGGSVGELTFQGESIKDTLGVVLFVRPGEEDEALAPAHQAPPSGLVIWTPTRVLVASAGGVRELTFQGKSIRNTLGMVFVSGLLVIWTPRRVLASDADRVAELTFQEESIEDTWGILPVPPTGDDRAPGLVIWTTDRVLTLSFSGGIVSELTFKGDAIKSNVRVRRQPFRRQAEFLTTNLYEVEAMRKGIPGRILMSAPLPEQLFFEERP